MRRIRAVTAIAAAGSLASGCVSIGGDGGSTNLAPTAAEAIGETSELFYDVSPDGEWISSASGDDVCLEQIASSQSPTCVELPPSAAGQVVWSPDSQHVVVVPDTIRRLEPGPLLVVGIDGSTESLAEPPDPEELSGAALGATFVDDDTIVYYALGSDEPRPAQIWSVDLDGEDPELLAEFAADDPDGPPLAPDRVFVVDDDVAYMSISFDREDMRIEAFDLEAGTRDVVLEGEGVDSLVLSPGPVAIADSMLLVVDRFRMGDYGRNARDGEFWTLVSVQDGTEVRVPDRGFFRTRSAMLSPDGAHVAIIEEYRGEDQDGEEDPDGQLDVDDPERIRVAVATTESILNEEAEWFDLSGFSSLGPAADLDGEFTGIRWIDDERLVLELQGGPVEVTLESA